MVAPPSGVTLGLCIVGRLRAVAFGLGTGQAITGQHLLRPFLALTLLAAGLLLGALCQRLFVAGALRLVHRAVPRVGLLLWGEFVLSGADAGRLVAVLVGHDIGHLGLALVVHPTVNIARLRSGANQAQGQEGKGVNFHGASLGATAGAAYQPEGGTTLGILGSSKYWGDMI